jgi:hypothetical protein
MDHASNVVPPIYIPYLPEMGGGRPSWRIRSRRTSDSRCVTKHADQYAGVES